MAAFVACSVLISLGYFIGLKKSVLTPCTSLRFLGYLCDSEKQAFILPDDKRISFASLRESILEKNSVSLKNLQKFAGKTTSFSLLVPAAKLYTNCVFQAIAKTIGKGKLQVNLSPSLRSEISHWKFLDSWDGFLKWKQEFHLRVHVFSDASNTGWGGNLHQPGKSPLETRGYWDTTERKLPIVVKESLALLRTLENLLHTHSNTRIDAFVHNKALLASWDKQVSKSPVIPSVMKSIFQFVFKRNILLSLHYVPSKENPADSPSRTLSDLDCSLSKDAWKRVETAFGPHSIDLMALPENF